MTCGQMDVAEACVKFALKRYLDTCTDDAEYFAKNVDKESMLRVEKAIHRKSLGSIVGSDISLTLTDESIPPFLPHLRQILSFEFLTTKQSRF
jgi:hypothetical protein